MESAGRSRQRLPGLLQSYSVLILALLMLLSLVLAYRHRFVQDDAFISFNYARSLLRGDGLTWFGTRVEGYTNFLWVLWISLTMKVGLDPIVGSYLGGITSFAFVILIVWKLSCRLVPDYVFSIFCILFFVTNYSVSSYATGGLETMLQTALLSGAMYCLYLIRSSIPEKGGPLFLLMSLLLALAVMVRMDSAIQGIVIAGCAFAFAARGNRLGRSLLCLTIPAVLLVGPWLIWKLHYYGRIFPNPYYAKMNWSIYQLRGGCVFLLRFFHWYMLWPIFVLCGLIWIKKRHRDDWKVLPLVLTTAIWCLYIASVGGDFMEFRFVIPMSPFLFILLTYLIYEVVGGRLLRMKIIPSIVCLIFLASVSVWYSLSFRGITKGKALDSIHALGNFYNWYQDKKWDRIGTRLGRSFRSVDVKIGAHAAGAIPYYSELKTVDMWGLNDPNIPFIGNHPSTSFRPGHRCSAPLSYLKQERINLIVGRPVPMDVFDDPGKEAYIQSVVRSFLPDNDDRIGTVTLVMMPLTDQEGFLMWYLTPTFEINRIIADHKWKTRTLYVYVR